MEKVRRKIGSINLESVFPLLFSGLAALISIATTFFIATPLGTERYGEIQYIIGIINTLSLVICFGFPTYLAKNSQFQENTKPFFSKNFFWMTAISLVVFPVFLCIGFFKLSGLNKNLWLIISLFLCSFFCAVCTLGGAYLIGIRKASLGICIQTFLPHFFLFVSSIIFILLNYYDQLVHQYYLLYLLSFGLVSLVFLFFTLRPFPKKTILYEKKEIAGLIIYFALDFAGNIQTSLSKIILGEVSSTFDNVGIFSLSLQVVSMGTLFSGVITSISRPFFSKLAKEGNDDDLFAFFHQTMRINCNIGIPFLMAFIVESKNVLSFFGGDYAKYPLIMVILGIGYLVNDIFGPLGTMLIMAGHEMLELINSGISLLLFFTIGISLARITIYGLPIAIAVSLISICVAKCVEAAFIYKRNPYDFQSVLYVLLLICISGAIFYCLSLITSRMNWLIANIIFGALTIIGITLLSPYKTDKYFFVNGGENDVKSFPK